MTFEHLSLRGCCSSRSNLTIALWRGRFFTSFRMTGDKLCDPFGVDNRFCDAVATKMQLLRSRTGANARIQILRFAQNDGEVITTMVCPIPPGVSCVYTKVIVTIPSACTTLEWSSKYRETESQDKPGASVWGNTVWFRAVLFVTFSYKEKVRRTINAGVECECG
jgi:hypothetical protein